MGEDVLEVQIERLISEEDFLRMRVDEYTEVIIEKDRNRFIIKCGFCMGLGTVDWSKTCPVCYGKGMVVLLIPDDSFLSPKNEYEILKCTFCSGFGRKSRYSDEICPVCKGVGAIIGTFPRIKCLRCGGARSYMTQNARYVKELVV
jgi:DnaJ-class molecular chaperone